jgi:hypothetical protein
VTAEGGRLELNRQRDLTALFADSLTVLRRHFGTFMALAAVVVVPVHVIVSGVGLEQLTGDYDSSPPLEEALIPTAVSFLVVAPLLNAICIRVLQLIAEGGSPSPRRAIVEGFEAFTPIFFAVLLAAAGIALGLLLFIVPGVYVAVRWFFVPQAVVIEGATGPAALARSMEVTQGFWWRTFGIALVANLAAAIPGLLLSAPLAALAESSGRAVWALAGTILTEMITTPFVALVATLLYYDLRARRTSGPA